MKKLLLTVFSFTACCTSILAQADTDTDAHNVTINLSEVAILDIESAGSTDITLGITAPTEAGLPADASAATDSSLWLNYTSILGAQTSRSVTAAITSGSVPAGVTLSVTAAGYAGTGDGTTGTTTGAVSLTGTPSDVITGIGSAYTGDGVSNGHNLTYTLTISDFSSLDADNAGSVEVTYTIVDVL